MHGKEKETHELIFSWLYWLAVLFVGAYARRKRRRRRRSCPTWRPYSKKETYNLCLPRTSLILDIPAMINWHLSNQAIRWPVPRDHIAGSSLQLIEVTCFYDRWPNVGFPIGSRAQVNLLITGQDCLGPDQGLKVNRIITFSSIKISFCCFVLCIWRCLKLKTEGRRKTSSQNSTFSWVSLIRLRATWPRSYAFRLA